MDPTDKPEPKEEKRAGPFAGAELIGLAWSLPVSIVLYSLLGFWLGRKAGHERAGTLIGIFVGLVVAGYEVARAAQRIDRQNRRK